MNSISLASDLVAPEQFLVALVESSDDAIISTTPEGRTVFWNAAAERLYGLSAAEMIGRDIAEVFPPERAREFASLLRVVRRGRTVRDVECQWSAEDGRLVAVSFTCSPVFGSEGEVIGASAIAHDITERTRAAEAQTALTHAAIDAIAAVGEVRDPYTAGHQGRVARMARAISLRLGLGSHEIEGIDLAARIHDIGKIGIPSEILTRSTRLSPPEWELVKTHCSAGADIVRGIAFPWPIADMVEQHHERTDGSGYPFGLSGEEIVLGARVIAVADVVDAMSSHRPYRPARGLPAALEEIERGRGRLFDPQSVDACVQLLAEEPCAFQAGAPWPFPTDLRSA